MGQALRTGMGAVALGFCLALSLAARAADDPWAKYEAAGARIGALRIVTSNVFDTSKPEESHWLARAANFIHITTRESVIREALLFKMGDPVNAAAIHETERLLRSLSWVQDATIEPVEIEPGSVQAVVKVHDGWSLMASLKYNHAGGETNWRIRVHEVNFLGFGKDLLLSHESDPERTTDEIGYRDPLLFGSRWTLDLGYATLSDGRSGRFMLERPFYELSANWSAGVRAASTQDVEYLYDDNDKVYAFPAKLTDVTLYARWQYAFANRTAWRAGVELRAMDASYGALSVLEPYPLPAPDLAPRRFRGILGYWGVSQDRFATYRNLQYMAHTEDINLGWDAEVHAGWMGKALGSYEDAWYGEFTAHKGTLLSDSSLLIFDGAGHGFKTGGGSQDVYTDLSFSFYNQSLPMQTLAANLELTVGSNLYPEDAIYIGGFDGLRGYPYRYRTGDRRWLFSAEDRIVTPWTFWGLVQVGFVAYVDAGAIRTFDGHFTKTYADVGGGLRFGNLKSTFGRVFLLTVAVPLVKDPGLDSYQIVAGTVIRF